jgi:hypothetical protein
MVEEHPGEVYSLAVGETLVGFVVGTMTRDRENAECAALLYL